MQRTDPAIGKIIDGYKILDVLGQGGMGIVYKAEDVALSRQVALKMINPELASQDTFLKRFQLEAKALARVDSPYIVGVHALRKSGEHVFIVMEYVDGWTLSDEMNNGTLDSKRAYSVLKQLLQAFSHAHGVGVVHRDIKPSNIMISRSGRVKVTDFGLAKLRREDGMTTVTQGIAGTARYMSPEQVLGKKIDHRSDIYSLGMTLYHMFAGKLPFEPEEGTYSILRRVVEEEFAEVFQINSKVPKVLSDVIAKALQKNPDDRYQTADEMLTAVEHAFNQGSQNPGETVTVQPKSRTGKNRKPLVLAALALCLILAYPVYYFIANSSQSDGAGQTSIRNQDNSTQPNQVLTNVDALDSTSTEQAPVLAYPSITSVPSGATILIDGDSVSVTPLRGRAIEIGTKEITIDLEGYESQSRSVVLAAGDITPIEFNLQLAESARSVTSTEVENNNPGSGTTSNGGAAPIIVAPPDPDIATATMRLTADPEGLIYVNGQQFANESVKDWQVGIEYTVSFVARDNPDIKRDTTFILADLSGVNITCYFERTLTVMTRCEDCVAAPSASISIDGQDVGSTPDVIPVQLGTYEVEVSKFGYVIDDPVRTVTLLPTFDKDNLSHKEFFQIRQE